jgi:hypothetical protein
MNTKKSSAQRPLRSLAAISLVLALSGCGLVQDTLGLTPSPAALRLEIVGPSNSAIDVTVSGNEYSERFTDDGTGFSTALALRPGTYTISALPQAGFAAQISVTQKNGNSTRTGTQTLDLESKAVVGVRVSYISIKP